MDHNNESLTENSAEMDKGKKIDVLMVEPGQYAKMVTIDNGLESLQKAVGGYIQAAYYYDDPVAVICNEEGKIEGLRPNRAIFDDNGKMVDIVAGTFLITGLGEEDFASLPKDLQEKYQQKFHSPETFLRLGEKILVLPTEPDRERKPKAKGKNSHGMEL